MAAGNASCRSSRPDEDAGLLNPKVLLQTCTDMVKIQPLIRRLLRWNHLLMAGSHHAAIQVVQGQIRSSLRALGLGIPVPQSIYQNPYNPS